MKYHFSSFIFSHNNLLFSRMVTITFQPTLWSAHGCRLNYFLLQMNLQHTAYTHPILSDLHKCLKGYHPTWCRLEIQQVNLNSLQWPPLPLLISFPSPALTPNDSSNSIPHQCPPYYFDPSGILRSAQVVEKEAWKRRHTEYWEAPLDSNTG